MRAFLLHHCHQAHECASAYAAWHGYDSPLRHGSTMSTCVGGGHEIWWRVEARDREQALSLLPRWVALRTEPIEVREVAIP